MGDLPPPFRDTSASHRRHSGPPVAMVAIAWPLGRRGSRSTVASTRTAAVAPRSVVRTSAGTRQSFRVASREQGTMPLSAAPHSQNVVHPGRGLSLGVLVFCGALAAGLMLYACVRVGAPAVLRVLFPLWVAAPFAALGGARMLSRRWSPPVRQVLDVVTIIIAVASCLLYAFLALGAARPRTAPFVLMPPASMIAALLVVAGAAFLRRKH
jgi:hypothetical protein